MRRSNGPFCCAQAAFRTSGYESSAPDVLGPHAHADQAPRNPAQAREAVEEPQGKRRPQRARGAGHARDDPVLHQDLQPLGDAYGPESPLLEVTVASTNQLRFSWPAEPAGFHLQVSDNPASGVFTNGPWSPLVEGDFNVISLPMTNTRQFFRLAY